MNVEYTIGLISDCHSNLPSLEAVLEDMNSKYPIAEIFNMGDIVGYYTQPAEVLKLCIDSCTRIIKGNHDDAIAKDFLNPEFNRIAAQALKFNIEYLNVEEKRLLNSLSPIKTFPLKIDDQNTYQIQMVHGSPEYPLDYYVFDGNDGPSNDQVGIAEYMDLVGIDIIIMGHTHRPYIRKIDNMLLINPGSTGQPRDGDPRASYSVFDPVTKSCIIERVSYDIDTTIQMIKEVGLPDQLGQRLLHGK